MRRSALLADVGVDTYDENDPRVKALGLGKLMVVVDECQLVLIPNTPLVPLVEQAAETMRKTGAGLVLATQLPQMRSLGGSVRLRDALVAGNALVLRLSNRGSRHHDPARTTSSVTRSRSSGRSTARAPPAWATCGTATASACSAASRTWTRPPPLPQALASRCAGTSRRSTRTPRSRPPGRAPPPAARRQRPAEAPGTGCAPRSASAARPTTAVVERTSPQTSAEWVLACLRRGPASAQALLDRPDCPVNQAQLYALLTKLKDSGRIVAPAQRGGPWTVSA